MQNQGDGDMDLLASIKAQGEAEVRQGSGPGTLVFRRGLSAEPWFFPCVLCQNELTAKPEIYQITTDQSQEPFRDGGSIYLSCGSCSDRVKGAFIQTIKDLPSRFEKGEVFPRVEEKLEENLEQAREESLGRG